MREIVIDRDGAGKRLDKLLKRYLAGAPESLLYAQLRKRNITLNGGRAAGRELLREGDRVQCFFSEETWRKFLHPALAAQETDGGTGEDETAREARACYLRHREEVSVLYEDEALLLLDKPAGMLTQRAAPGDESLNDWLLGFLLAERGLSPASLAVFRPAVCHRLDRNTSGIVICARSLAAAQEVARMLKDRSLGKFYLTAVHGRLKEAVTLTGAVEKDRKRNKVRLFEAASSGEPVRASFRPLRYAAAQDVTLVEAKLLTGRTHQLRVQLAGAGHPIVGDRKYGGEVTAKDARRFGANYQLLHCASVRFPRTEGALSSVSGREFSSAAPFAGMFPGTGEERTARREAFPSEIRA